MTKLDIPYSTYGFYYTAATRLGCINIEFLDLLELENEIKNKSKDVLKLLKAFVDSQKFKKEVSDYNWKIISGETPKNQLSKDYLYAREKCNNARLELIKGIKDYRVKHNIESL